MDPVGLGVRLKSADIVKYWYILKQGYKEKGGISIVLSKMLNEKIEAFSIYPLLVGLMSGSGMGFMKENA